ncbi:MAG: phosphatidate cytidylyltransferase [Sphingobium sp.]|nr:phosphatidate cytidylyltransferase [Sphingobium sp.]
MANDVDGDMAARPRSDLRTRLISAIVMVAVAGVALFIGGWLLQILVAGVAIGLFWEFRALVRAFVRKQSHYILWMLGGACYIGFACLSLLQMESLLRWVLIAAVIATDSGAYFAGRKFGGAKIAPSISPSKTWAGLYGGMAGAAIVLLLAALRADGLWAYWWGAPLIIFMGCVLAVVAQAGDFFESWMKRRAGVKDSGALIPGHGGLFDRVDGLLAVLAFGGLCKWLGLLSWAGMA